MESTLNFTNAGLSNEFFLNVFKVEDSKEEKSIDSIIAKYNGDACFKNAKYRQMHEISVAKQLVPQLSHIHGILLLDMVKDGYSVKDALDNLLRAQGGSLTSIM